MGFFCPHGSTNGYFFHPPSKAGTGTFFHTQDTLPDGTPVFTMTCEPTFKPWLHKHPNSNLIPTSPHCSKPPYPIQPPLESRPPPHPASSRGQGQSALQECKSPAASPLAALGYCPLPAACLSDSDVSSFPAALNGIVCWSWQLEPATEERRRAIDNLICSLISFLCGDGSPDGYPLPTRVTGMG